VTTVDEVTKSPTDRSLRPTTPSKGAEIVRRSSAICAPSTAICALRSTDCASSSAESAMIAASQRKLLGAIEGRLRVLEGDIGEIQRHALIRFVEMNQRLIPNDLVASLEHHLGDDGGYLRIDFDRARHLTVPTERTWSLLDVAADRLGDHQASARRRPHAAAPRHQPQPRRLPIVPPPRFAMLVGIPAPGRENDDDDAQKYLFPKRHVGSGMWARSSLERSGLADPSTRCEKVSRPHHPHSASAPDGHDRQSQQASLAPRSGGSGPRPILAHLPLGNVAATRRRQSRDPVSGCA
jgi:hypothetical protein